MMFVCKFWKKTLTQDVHLLPIALLCWAKMNKRTFIPKIDVQRRQWRVVDADGLVLGRLAVQIADALRGKDKPTFSPHMDGGDFVVVVNAEKIVLTGKKEIQKEYMSYSGWKGGEKYRSVAQVRADHPERLVMHAVKGMLPKNRLADRLLTKLKVYAGPTHPHSAQTPAAMAYAG
jgi:large subunit ribosomal protein L13